MTLAGRRRPAILEKAAQQLVERCGGLVALVGRLLGLRRRFAGDLRRDVDDARQYALHQRVQARERDRCLLLHPSGDVLFGAVGLFGACGLRAGERGRQQQCGDTADQRRSPQIWHRAWVEVLAKGHLGLPHLSTAARRCAAAGVNRIFGLHPVNSHRSREFRGWPAGRAYSPAPGPGRGLVVAPAAVFESSAIARCCSSRSNSLDTIRQEATGCFPAESTKALTIKNRVNRAVASSCSCASPAAARIRSRISSPARTMRSFWIPQRWALPKRKPPSAATRAASVVLGLAISRAATVADASADMARLRTCTATDNARKPTFVAETATSAGVFLLLFHAITLLRVIMDFEEQAAAVRLERTVHGPRRTAGIGARGKAFAPLAFRVVADRQIALDQVDLFPVFVNKGRGGEDMRRETQKARAAAAPARLIERAGEDLLLDPGGITGRGAPTGRHIDGMELAVRLVDLHLRLLLRFSL